MKKKVLVILIGNISFDGRVQKTIKTLQKLNFDVELLCTDINENDSLENYNFKIWLKKRKSKGGIITQAIRNLKFYFYARKLIKRSSPDYIHCNDLSSTFYALGNFNNIKVVYDAHELALEITEGLVNFIFTRLERYVVRKSYKIILPQIDRLNYFHFKYYEIIDKSKLFLIENFPVIPVKLNNEFFKTEYSFDKKGKIIVSYTGAITKERKLEILISSMKSVRNHIVLFIIGNSSPAYYLELQKIIIDNKLENKVFIKPPIFNKYILDVAASSDIGVCFYSDFNLNSYFCASNKLYEYLDFGSMVLSNNISGTNRVINHKVNGFLIDEITEESIVVGINFLSENIRRIDANYYWENQECIFNDIYQ